MKKIKTIIALIVSISILGLSGCSLISKTPEAIAKTVLIKVNDETLTKQQFDKKLQTQIAYYEQYYGYGEGYFSKSENASALKSLKEGLLDNLADEMFGIQKAKELKLVLTDAELNTEVDKTLKEQMDKVGGETAFKKELEALKYTEDDFKQSIKDQIIIEKLYDYIVKDVTATDEEINKYYQENLYDYTTKTNVMNLSHILVKTEDEALKIREEYKAGKSFEELAKQYSTDTGSKDNGGLLGDVEYNNTQLDQTFMTNAKMVPQGAVSEPVHTQFGWHLIKCNKKTEYPVKPLSQVKEDVKSKVLEQKKSDKYSTQISDWKKKATIKIYKDRL